MEEINRFNVRVYALLIVQEKLLILKEPYAGEILYKFPGGGVDFGEGIKDALKRELLEELNLKVSQYQHFYTQESFVPSQFRKNEQLITVYYTIQVSNIQAIKILENRIETLIWKPLDELNTQDVNLPVDQLVVKKLKASFK